MLNKIETSTLVRVANRVHAAHGGGCHIIDAFTDPFSQNEEADVARELLFLREQAELMARLLEINAEDDLGQTTKYREEYPKGE